MNRNVMIVLAGGFLIAVLVALLVQASLSGKKQEVAIVKEEPKVKIVVAATDIKKGATIAAENVKWQEWPKNGVFPGAFVQKGSEKAFEAANGRIKTAVKMGEPIVSTNIVADVGVLSTKLNPGMRAIAISVKAANMAAGFIGPGDYVDVILTYKDKITYDGEDNASIDNMIENTIDTYATETILENIRVLAVDQSSARDEDKKVKVGKTVTLEVDRRSAEILALADTMGGRLSLALRGLGDEKIVGYQYPIITDARITNIYDEVMTEISKQENMSGQNADLVRIYNGGAVNEITVLP